ncbi:CDP-glucose 4,6-dehydratase [Acidihalobacter aeolianus]|uniref:CDP-glucose 4,6-dehydratase n=1 Tax=Acidihalobacter aeolianus TaxID=2792603 RepID=A0A1D8K951_9GAMM|nr:CDP-glucose 4,6-dehydratase [Acidihalobacter aeolianus]AOV17472.1 CDP-glucose 4,6-dehydratase [Acidihalobacter aeolianus]
MFSNIYSGKKVLITGNTGFKGAWLSAWCDKLGANIVGMSRDIPTTPSMYETLGLSSRVEHHMLDIVDLNKVVDVINAVRPDFVFHLAAQPIVSTSYKNPIDTFSSNVIGTAHILEALRRSNHNCVAVIITSDKAYDNVEQVWGYREIDALGGKDIYSGSKGAAELVIKSYINSYFIKSDSNVRIGVARAGNVIGGGDWAVDRIVVDCMRNWSQGEKVRIRSPNATRPWQHVLEPLSGYLLLGKKLYEGELLHGQAFNFGPKPDGDYTVKQLLSDLSVFWGFSTPEDSFDIETNNSFKEAGLLKLNCDKALFHMNWSAVLKYHEMVRFTSDWYYNYYHSDSNMMKFTIDQIQEYEEIALSRGLAWTA